VLAHDWHLEEHRYIVNIDLPINVMKPNPYFLSAEAAAEALGVTRATLYAYASRGQVRSEPVPGRVRERRYHREDIERLMERKDARRDPASVAARGLHWGGPVLESAITLIHDGRLYYRGRDALRLAQTADVEDVAALLWQADDVDPRQLFDQPCVLPPHQLARVRACADNAFTRIQTAMPVAGALDLAAYDLRAAAVRQSAARIMKLSTILMTRGNGSEPIHRALQAAWAPGNDAVGDAIGTTLILCADHELNVSAFTARCTASAGASPYDVVTAAMATLKGYRHGGVAERVLALLEECETPRRARAAVAKRLRLGERVPGFGHRLYPTGDPRAARLLQIAEAGGNESAWKPIRNLCRAGTDLLQDLPNLDLGLAALRRAFRLPEQAPLLLFALGRTMGWMAHAIEAYSSGQMVRPRARYVGPAPVGGLDAG
jgi:citrate synthase